MGSILGLGGRTNKKQSPATSLRIQTSVQGQARAIGAGQNRVAGNMIWYGNFVARKQKNAAGKGGGGGKGGQAGYNYYASAIMGLADGPIADLMTIYQGNNVQFVQPPDPAVLADLQALGINQTAQSQAPIPFAFFAGTYTQGTWGFVEGVRAAQALTYRGLAYVGHPNVSLGSSTTFPNYTYEVKWAVNTGAPGVIDANPADWISALLTNPDWGVQGFPAALLGDLAPFATYARAYGLFVSPALSDAVAAQSHLGDLLKSTGADFRWSQGRLDIVIYADVAATGYGVTWVPSLAAVYDLTADHFLPGEDSGATRSPIATKRPPADEVTNQLAVEFLDRSNLYNPVAITATDEAAIAASGRVRKADKRSQHWFCRASAASAAASLQLARERQRRTHTFRLPEQFILLDLGDIVTLTEARMGYDRLPVRIVEIKDNGDRSLTFTTEDVPGTIRAVAYDRQKSQGAAYNAAEDPGDINPPVILEPPAALGANQVWVALCGQNDATWGGAIVHVSLDGETYTQIGQISGASTMGVLTAALPGVSTTSPNGTPDTANTLAVDLTESQGSLASVTDDGLAALATLSYVDGELLAWRDATLTGPYRYTLADLIRGTYGTTPSAHSAGSAFVRLDGTLFQYTYPPNLVGHQIWFKFQSFNTYGGGSPSLDALTAYPYTIAGQSGMTSARVADADHTVTPSETGVYYTAITADRTVGLPAAQIYPTGQSLTVVDQSGAASGSARITITARGSDQINGAALTRITTAYGSVTLTSDGASRWSITSRVGS